MIRSRKNLIFLLMVLTICLTSCDYLPIGNTSIEDDFTNESNTFNYAVMNQTIDNITYRVLYPVDKWTDSESDAFCIKFTMNDKYQIIWTSFNTCKLYHIIPEVWEYDVTYENLCKQYAK